MVPAATSSPRPLLVTGLPRSGTSWVGKMLAASDELVYVNEPLNPRRPPGRSPGVLDADVTHRFQYICEDNEDQWAPAFADTVRLRYHPIKELRRNRNVYDLARMAKYYSAFSAGRLRDRRALLDDPYAVLSTAWFVEHLGCHALVLVRDPLSFVGSWRRLGWTIHLRELLDQPLLVRDLPDHFVAEMDELADSSDMIAKTALLWRLTYTHVQRLNTKVEGLWVRRYEDLASEPMAHFPALYSDFGLTWSSRAVERVRAASSDREGKSRARSPYKWSLRGGLSRTAYHPMDATRSLGSYHERLTPAEIERVRALTADVAHAFYEGEWV